MLLLVGALAVASGCAAVLTSVRSRFHNDYDCNSDVDVRRVGLTNTYVASGCGYKANYTCLDDFTCVRERPALAAQPAAASRAPDVAPAQVERRYDRARKIQIVRANFGIEPGVTMTLVGAPQAKLSDVLLEVRVHGYRIPKAACDKVEILVNSVPSPGTDLSLTYGPTSLVQQAHFDFSLFKPLGKDFPSFGARVCGRDLNLSEAAVVQLRKFLVIFSDLANEVQKTDQPTESKQGEVKSL